MAPVHLSNAHSNVIITGGRLIFDNPDKECSNVALPSATGTYTWAGYFYGQELYSRPAAYPAQYMFTQLSVTAPKTGVMFASIGVRCRIYGGGGASAYDYANATAIMYVNSVFVAEGAQYRRIGRNTFTEEVVYGTCFANVSQGDTVHFGVKTIADAGQSSHTYDDNFEYFWYSASTMTI